MRREVGLHHFNGKILTYPYVEKDVDGWANADAFVPNRFELALCRLDNGITHVGWWTGNGWCGQKIKDSDRVVAWKKGKEYYD